MKWKIGISYGALVWFISFLIEYFIYPSKLFYSPLFEMIMIITFVLIGSIFLILYIKESENFNFIEGVKLGILFFTINIIIEFLTIIIMLVDIFLSGDLMNMLFFNYIVDTWMTNLEYPVLAYLVYPILGAFSGYIYDLE